MDLPIKIIKYVQKYNGNFFYPSTEFINQNDKSDYSKFKLMFEKKVLKFKNNLNIKILKIPRINTKQNLNLFDEKLPNFRDILNKNNNFQKSIFFEN